MYIIQTILVALLFIVSFIMDNLMAYNIVLNPVNMPAVVAGWTVLREIANSLFLLILLWIALQIIWGLGEGSRRFLVRLIIIAFLINFSLALTGAVFGLGSALANPFRKAMGDDVAGWIIDKTKLNTAPQEASSLGSTQQAAAFASDSKSCGFGSLVDATKYASIRIGCPLGNAVTEVMKFINETIAGRYLQIGGVTNTLNMGIANIFLLLTIITFGGASGMLLMRIVMMVFLGVLAPAAFFLYAVPGADANFRRWMKQVLAWAFIAPMFYFMFYISLLVLDAMTSTQILKTQNSPTFASNIFAMLPLVVFLVFLWATMWMSKKMAGPIAQQAINFGTKAAGLALTGAAAVATGGAALAVKGAAMGATKAMGGTATEGSALNRLAATPYVGRIADPLLKYDQRRREEKQKKITQLRESYGALPAQIRKRKLQTTLRADHQIALAESLHQDNEFQKLSDEDQKKYVGYATQLGRTDLLKARPDLVKQENVSGAVSENDARRRLLTGMTPEEKSKISMAALDEKTMDDLLRTASRKDIETIVRSNADMTQKLLFEYYNDHKDRLRAVVRPDTHEYITANMLVQTQMGKKRGEWQWAGPEREIKESYPPERQIEMAEERYGRNQFDTITDTVQRRVMNYVNQSRGQDLLFARPDFATQQNVAGSASNQDALRKIITAMSAEQKSRISPYALNPNVMQELLRSASIDDIKAMVKNNAEMTKKLLHDYFAKNAEALRATMNAETHSYVSTVSANMTAQMREATARPQQRNTPNTTRDVSGGL